MLNNNNFRCNDGTLNCQDRLAEDVSELILWQEKVNSLHKVQGSTCAVDCSNDLSEFIKSLTYDLIILHNNLLNEIKQKMRNS